MKALIIAALLGALPTQHHVLTSVCGAYQGSWNQEDAVQFWREPIKAYCAVNDEGNAKCTVSTGSESWSFSGSVVKDEPSRFVIEGYDTTGRTFQLLCQNKAQCVGFRVFNQSKQVGMQCVKG